MALRSGTWLWNATVMVYCPNRLASWAAAHSSHVLCSSCAMSKCHCQHIIHKVQSEMVAISATGARLLLQNKAHSSTETAGLWDGCTWQGALSICEFHVMVERERMVLSLRLHWFHFSAVQNHTHTHTYEHVPSQNHTDTQMHTHTRLRADARQKQTMESYSPITSRAHC